MIGNTAEPRAPGAPEIEEIDVDFILIKWTPPSDDGGSPIINYTVERKEKKSRKWSIIGSEIKVIKFCIFIVIVRKPE